MFLMRVAHAHEAEPAEVLTRRSFCLGLGNTLNLLCFPWFTTGFLSALISVSARIFHIFRVSSHALIALELSACRFSGAERVLKYQNVSVMITVVRWFVVR